MYTLLIVEDEPLIREGLKQYFPWRELGVHRIAEAENGREGMLTALRERPDLIITDIRMPEIDGLDMLGRLRAELPDAAFVILTGYNDFQYAQKAIRLGGVHAYLLKPLQYEESLATIRQCLDSLGTKLRERQLRADLEREAAETAKLKGSQLVKLLLEEDGPPSEETVRRLCGPADGVRLFQPFVVSCVPRKETDRPLRRGWRHKAESLAAEAAALLHPQARRQTLTCADRSKMYAVTVCDIPADDGRAAVRPPGGQLQHLPELPAADDSAALYLAVGEPTFDWSRVGASLRQAEKALYGRYVQPGRRVFHPPAAETEAERDKDKPLHLEEKDKQQMIACLENGDALQARQLMRRLAEQTVASNASPDRWLAFLQETVSVTLRFAHRSGIPVEGVYSDRLLTLACADEFPSAEALFDWLAEWMIRLGADYREKAREAAASDVYIFEQMEAFIKRHIDRDITLQMVADRFFYNPSYLSRLFKTKLNKNYMAFVTEIRIACAKQRLKEPQYLVTDICQMCGYKSYKHFVKTFRSVTGMTPTDYRKQVGL